MRDVDRVEKALTILEQGYSLWANESPKDDLKRLIAHVQRLDFDIGTMFSDCVSLGRQYWKDHNFPVIHSLHRSLAIMNNLFDDLKKVGMAPGEAYINPSDLRQLGRDWNLFKKSISQVHKSMKHLQPRRKKHAWARLSSLKGEGAS